jgi:hypothetical protein
MSEKNLNKLIPGDDEKVEINTKTNISVLDYLTYLVGCMIPSGSSGTNNRTNEVYILTIHDDTSYEKYYYDADIIGPYFKISRASHIAEHSDAYEIDIGYNTANIVTNFSVQNNENYSLFYDYQQSLNSKIYTRRINEEGI